MNLAGSPLSPPREAALKTHALQTLRDCRASPNRAKRLECVRFIGAFRQRETANGSWPHCTISESLIFSKEARCRDEAHHCSSGD